MRRAPEGGQVFHRHTLTRPAEYMLVKQLQDLALAGYAAKIQNQLPEAMIEIIGVPPLTDEEDLKWLENEKLWFNDKGERM